MKKCISVLLSILMIFGSCTCSLVAFAADCVHVYGNYFTDDMSHMKKCTKCGEVEKGAHEFALKSETALTHTTSGVKTYECNVCKKIVTEVTKAPGHTLMKTDYVYDILKDGKSHYNVKTYCYELGKDTPCIDKTEVQTGAVNRCPNCYKMELRKKTVNAPTCTSAGYTTYDCRECGIFSLANENSNAVPCSYKVEVHKATCNAGGYTVKTCYYCKKVVTSQPTLPLAHQIDCDALYVVDTVNGTIYGICALCKKAVTFPFENASSLKCPECESTVKTIRTGKTCGDNIQYVCTNGHTVDGAPLGHELVSTKITYSGANKITTINCKRCGVQTSEETITENDVPVCTICKKEKISSYEKLEATCSVVGYEKTTCRACGERTISTARTLMHIPEVRTWVRDFPSRTTIYKVQCGRFGCEGQVNETMPLDSIGSCPKCGGKVTKKIQVSESCNKSGYTSIICENCNMGEKYTENFDGESLVMCKVLTQKATGKHTEVTTENAPTCTESGSKLTTCTKCLLITGKINIPAAGHKLTNGYTSTINGNIETKNGYCSVCGTYQSITENLTIVPTCSCGANITKKVVVAPTCRNTSGNIPSVVDGYTQTTCDRGHTEKIDYVKGSHDFDGGKVQVAPTCTNAGLMVYTCNKCGYKETKPITRLIHQYVYTVQPLEPTCTEWGHKGYGYCVLCGEQVGSYDANGNVVNVIAPLGHKMHPDQVMYKNFCVRCNQYILSDNKDDLENPTNPTCDCLCHNDIGFFKVVFRFMLFFYKILGIKETCDCGKVHYSKNDGIFGGNDSNTETTKPSDNKNLADTIVGIIYPNLKPY